MGDIVNIYENKGVLGIRIEEKLENRSEFLSELLLMYDWLMIQLVDESVIDNMNLKELAKRVHFS